MHSFLRHDATFFRLFDASVHTERTRVATITKLKSGSWESKSDERENMSMRHFSVGRTRRNGRLILSGGSIARNRPQPPNPATRDVLAISSRFTGKIYKRWGKRLGVLKQQALSSSMGDSDVFAFPSLIAQRLPTPSAGGMLMLFDLELSRETSGIDQCEHRVQNNG